MEANDDKLSDLEPLIGSGDTILSCLLFAPSGAKTIQNMPFFLHCCTKMPLTRTNITLRNKFYIAFASEMCM